MSRHGLVMRNRGAKYEPLDNTCHNKTVALWRSHRLQVMPFYVHRLLYQTEEHPVHEASGDA